MRGPSGSCASLPFLALLSLLTLLGGCDDGVTRVPPELIGDSANKTYSNYREARRAFYEETILPLMVMLRDKLNMWLMPLFNDGMELDFDTDQVSALQEDRAMLFERLTKANWLEINEKRDEAGFDETEGGDAVLVGLAQVPLASLGSAHRPEDFRCCVLVAHRDRSRWVCGWRWWADPILRSVSTGDSTPCGLGSAGSGLGFRYDSTLRETG